MFLHTLTTQWRDLSREEQEKYYAKAKVAREIHRKLHPNWVQRDSLGKNLHRRKKVKTEKSLASRAFKEFTNSGNCVPFLHLLFKNELLT